LFVKCDGLLWTLGDGLFEGGVAGESSGAGHCDGSVLGVDKFERFWGDREAPSVAPASIRVYPYLHVNLLIRLPGARQRTWQATTPTPQNIKSLITSDPFCRLVRH
jgi:hypothetical protein